LGLVGVVWIIGGCGGSGSAEPAVTKRQFDASAESICRHAVNAYFQRLASRSNAAGPHANAKAGVPPLKRAASQLSELEAPDGEEVRPQALAKAIKHAIEELEGGNDRVSGPRSVFSQLDEVAQDDDLQACSL